MFLKIQLLLLVGAACSEQDKGQRAGWDHLVGMPMVSDLNHLPTDEDASCTLDDGSIGECVPYYLCDTNRVMIEEGHGVNIHPKYSPCALYLNTCCPVEAERPLGNPIIPKPESVIPREGCGWRNSKGANLRTTGETDDEAKFGEFPWMVAIMGEKRKNVSEDPVKNYAGGGSLINPSVVLTGANVAVRVKELTAVSVIAGDWDTGTTKEIYPHQERDVGSMEIHKDFNSGNLFFDIALLFLTTPVDLAPHIGVACLPPPMNLPVAGTRCFATGWGWKFAGDQRILKKVELPVIERNACQEAFRKTRLGIFFKLHISFMCAGGEKDVEICRGDAGSPLSCPIKAGEDRYMQTGIAAWRIGCGADGNPGSYVDVGYMRPWIDEKMEAHGYGTKSYTI